jgi:hypothetical protein
MPGASSFGKGIRRGTLHMRKNSDTKVPMDDADRELIRCESLRRLPTRKVDGLHLPVLPEKSPVVPLSRILILEDE